MLIAIKKQHLFCYLLASIKYNAYLCNVIIKQTTTKR
nr:MAG TPA: hypothetical protein [Caudoviricetes sp.]